MLLIIIIITIRNFIQYNNMTPGCMFFGTMYSSPQQPTNLLQIQSSDMQILLIGRIGSKIEYKILSEISILKCNFKEKALTEGWEAGIRGFLPISSPSAMRFPVAISNLNILYAKTGLLKTIHKQPGDSS